MTEIQYTAQLKGKLKLSKFGEWYHEGKIFERKSLSDLFHRSIVWDENDKAYYVRLGAQQATFDCEDTAFFVTDLRENNDVWEVVLAGGSTEPLALQSLAVGAEGQIYCQVKGSHKARLRRGAHQQLMTFAEDEKTINLGGKKILIKKET